MSGANFNRAGRRSGGDRPLVTRAAREPVNYRIDSLPCFERRHSECPGTCVPMAPDKCECPCHTLAAKPEAGGAEGVKRG